MNTRYRQKLPAGLTYRHDYEIHLSDESKEQYPELARYDRLIGHLDGYDCSTGILSVGFGLWWAQLTREEIGKSVGLREKVTHLQGVTLEVCVGGAWFADIKKARVAAGGSSNNMAINPCLCGMLEKWPTKPRWFTSYQRISDWFEPGASYRDKAVLRAQRKLEKKYRIRQGKTYVQRSRDKTRLVSFIERLAPGQEDTPIGQYKYRGAFFLVLRKQRPLKGRGWLIRTKRFNPKTNRTQWFYELTPEGRAALANRE